jgi:hypothetical protein
MSARPSRNSEGYVFDAARIERIDRLRHDIVHKHFGRAVPNVDQDIEYLQETQFNLSQLITHRYGMKLGPGIIPRSAVSD